jgi:hypothetical protein
MVGSLTPDAFYISAREFAQTALEAHHAERYRLVAVHAGTALEHLAKACLARRSPALLTELKGETNFPSLLQLLGFTGDKALRQLRTVSLRDALVRVKMLVPSNASGDDLRTLVDVRDGTVHAAQEDELEERLLVAFVQHADALLTDLGRDRAAFWGPQLSVVDALLADASDKVAHRLAVKIAAAKANFHRLYSDTPGEVVELVRRLAAAEERGMADEEPADCPACGSRGMSHGDASIQYVEDDEDGHHLVAEVWWDPWGFTCPVCKLRLESAAELNAAAMQRWKIKGANPLDYVGQDY